MRSIGLILLLLSSCAAPYVGGRSGPPGAGYVEVEGGRIHYRISGRGSPLVLLHGARLDHSMWNPVIPHLSGRFRIVRWDAPGHGASTAPAQPTANTADELLGLLDQLDLGRVTLVGFSMGAGTATRFALEHPSRVSGLVLVSTSGPPPGAPASRSAHPPLTDAEGRRLLAAAGVPVLVIVGERDSEHVGALADAVEREVRGARLLVIAAAAHDVVADRPLDFARAIRRFATAEAED